MTKRTYILTLLLTISLCAEICLISAHNHAGQVSILNQQNNGLKRQIEALEKKSAEIAGYKAQIDNLTQQVSQLRESYQQVTGKLSRGGERITKRVMHCTAYWEGSCGKTPDDPAYGITASGKRVQEGMIAAYWPELPKGTRVYIPALDKVYTVEDKGGAIGRGDVYIYMPTARECFEFGVRDLEVWVIDRKE